MLYAKDKSGNRVYIYDTDSNQEYFCPCCNEKLVLKKGKINIHHFAHKNTSTCNDNWHYDMSDWHLTWQNYFPRECQEVVKQKNGKIHRADVLIEKLKTVIEFQHSQLSSEEFEDRNTFFNSLGYKVVWVFDLIDYYENEIIFENENRENVYNWKRPKNTFNSFDYSNKNVILFFQLTDTYLIKVSWVSPEGFKVFKAGESIYLDEFLNSLAKYININYYHKLDEINDRLKLVYKKDHTTYFSGCPLSKTGLCCNSTIDINESMYEEIKPCELCIYNKGQYYSECSKRINDLKLPLNTKVKYYERNKDGSLKSLVYISNDGDKRIDFPKIIHKTFGSSIIELWIKNKPNIAIFKNTRTDYYAMINKNPIEQMSKYKKCYGKLSKSQYDFSKESIEIYNVLDEEWIMVWNK